MGKSTRVSCTREKTPLAASVFTATLPKVAPELLSGNECLCLSIDGAESKVVPRVGHVYREALASLRQMSWSHSGPAAMGAGAFVVLERLCRNFSAQVFFL